MFQVDGKVALITGALGGIGRCYTKELLRHKAKGIALLDIDDKNAHSFQKELDNEFGTRKTIFIKIDLTDTLQIENAFQTVLRHFKHLDIVINNAGIMDECDVLRAIKINFVAVAFITNLAFMKYLKPCKKEDECVIVNTASTVGLFPTPPIVMYCSSKHAVVMLGRAFGSDIHYNHRNVKVLTICPGATETPMTTGKTNLPDYLRETTEALIKTVRCQRAENLGTALIDVIRNGNSGSVWTVRSDKPAEEVDFSGVDNLMFPYIN